MRNQLIGGVLALFSFVCSVQAAGTVASLAEQQAAQDLGASGPVSNKGVGALNLLGTLALVDQVDDLKQYSMRVREITVLPGGVIAVHKHDKRPGVAYILSGEVLEHREGSESGIVRRKGDMLFEKNGMVHWWENVSQEAVTALVIDLIPAENP